MDPVTHAATGLVGAQLARRHLPGVKWLTPFCVAAAMAPAIDLALVNGDPVAYLLTHRGITHSVILAPLYAALLATCFKALQRQAPWPRLWATALGLLLVHDWLDVVTAFGTQMLAPFRDTRFSLDAMYIVDPVFLASLLLLALFGRLARPKAHVFALAALAWTLAYPLSNMGIRDRLEYLYAAKLKREGQTVLSVRFSPEAFTPLYWKIIVDHGDRVSLTQAHALDFTRVYEGKDFAKADPALMAALSRQDGFFGTYAWFSRFPVQTVEEKDGLTVVEFRDLRFDSVNPLVKAMAGDRSTIFTLTAVLDPASGRLLQYVYQGTGPGRVSRSLN